MMSLSVKPIIRWTVGSVHALGFQTLQHSIQQAKRIYGDTFHYVVCYNNCEFVRVENIGCYHIEQSKYKNILDIEPPNGPSWKLYPPRLSLNTHEIFIDNDLILYGKLPQIDNFLASPKSFIATEPLRRRYGVLDKFVDNNFLINTGLFGLPPGFNFADKLKFSINKFGLTNWTTRFDEQGLVASILQRYNTEIVPLQDISICGGETSYHSGKFGIHFIGVNTGSSVHWYKYQNICKEKNKEMLH